MTSVWICFVIAAGFAAGPEPRPVKATEPPSPSAHVAGSEFEEARAADSLFRFQSRFWPNLHHFAFEQALLTSDPPITRGSTGEVASTAGLSADEAAAWTRTVGFYRDSLIERDLLFDNELLRLDRILADLPADAGPDGLAAAGVPEPLAAVLGEAAPAYRRRWWPTHDERNRRWIAEIEALVERYGGELASGLAAAYRSEWQRQVITVDVLVYANWAGAYTSPDPPHLRVSSSLEANQGWGALETVFHEASHTMVGGRRGAVAEAIREEAERAGVTVPRWLWHAIIFYTTGELVRRALQEDTAVLFVPYAVRTGLWERDEDVRAQFEALREHWEPYLDGKTGFEPAIAAVLAELRTTPTSATP